MLHELLMALQGHPGQIFYLQGSGQRDENPQFEENSSLKVNSALSLFHPCEINIIEGLLKVGTEFGKIENFIRTHGTSGQNSRGDPDRTGFGGTKGDGFRLQGLYVEALCHGLSEVLIPYRKVLVTLEKDILMTEGREVQISQFQHRIMPFLPLLSALNHLIRMLNVHRAHGCFILDIIYKSSCSGVDKIQKAMKRLLQEGHKVLYKQLLSWILQGKLFDPFEEFFIRPEICDVTNLADDQKTSFISMESYSTQNRMRIRHKLRPEMVPGHISMVLAEKIFFIGESIQLFESDRKLETHGAVLRDREIEFYQKMAALRDEPEFQISSFEKFVDSIRNSVSQSLHSLVLERSNLRDEIGIIRDFFLLGRGELFQTFIRITDHYLRKPISATTAHDVNQSFISACRSILSPEDDTWTKRLKVKVTEPLDSSSNPNKAVVGWKCISLKYSIPWPLHLIFSENSLNLYNKIFRFLLTVKRAQMALHDAWAEQKMAQRGRKKKLLKHDEEAELRIRMTFVVDNLQQYFMADVLEAQNSVLMNKLDQSENFEDLGHAHDVFLSEVASLTFINNKPVHQCLNELLSACLHFTRLLETPISEQEEDKFLVLERKKKIRFLCLSFGRQSEFLFRILSSLRHHHSGSHLAQLLFRIDYNRYFSINGHDVGKISA